MNGLMLSASGHATTSEIHVELREATMVVKLTAGGRRISTSTRRKIGRSMLTGLHRGGAALAGYRDDPEAAEQVVRAVAAVGALLATLMRAGDGGAAAAGYQRRRASAEQVIRDISAVGALLALVLRHPRAAGPVRWDPRAACPERPRGG